ncbi:MAG: hypothetical protein KAW45_05405 [Thermoplasmatales archaeon]|nr:hypothetical protein [Thermoplasmatales archaeon]
MNKKVICTIFVTCFLSVSINQCIADIQIPEKSDPLCYGFIVSPITDGNFTIIDQTNCRIRHMINDLLREQISVYWTAESINVIIKEMNNSAKEQNKLFESGSFIIPFTGNLTDDKKIIAIIYDYNKSSEIEIDDEQTIPIYIISEQITSQTYPLDNVKAAQFYSPITSGGFIYLELLSKCGFLNVEIFREKEIYHKLNTNDFNVL